MEDLKRHGPLIGILVLGAVLYTYGLDWGIRSLADFRVNDQQLSFFQSGFHPDSNSLETATASLSRSIYPSIERDGKTFLFSSYGPVYMYLFWTAAHVAGALFDFVPFGTSIADADATRVVGRGVSAAAGIATLYLVYLLGFRAYGRRTGLLAAFLLAVMPMAIQAAKFATVDGLLATGAAWICLHALEVAREGRRRDYVLAGIAVGVTVATKLNGAMLATAVAIGHCHRVLSRDGLNRGSLRLLLLDRSGWISAGCALLVYAVLTPAALFRFEDYFLTEFYGNIFHDVWVNVSDVGRDTKGLLQRGSLYLKGAPAYLYHLTDVFPSGLGWLLEAAVLAGCGYAAYRRARADTVLLGTVLVYSLIVGSFYDKPIRYFVVMGPLFAVIAARVLAVSTDHRRVVFRDCAWAAILLVGGHTAARGIAQAGIYTQPDARLEAAAWLGRNVRPGSYVLFERGHNNLVNLVSGQRFKRFSMDIESEVNLSKNEDLARDGDYVARLFTDYLAKVNYLLISDDRTPMRRASRVADDFYGRLFDGSLGYELAASFEVRPSLLGIRIDDSGSDLNLRRYDHPAAYVFKKVGPPSIFEDRPDLAIYQLRRWEDCLAVVNRALEHKEVRLFHMCLPRELKKSLKGPQVQETFDHILDNPEIAEMVQQQAAFIQEDGVWRLSLIVE